MRPVSAGATGLGKKGMAKTFAETVANRLLLGQIFYRLYFNHGGLTPVNTITGGFMWFLYVSITMLNLKGGYLTCPSHAFLPELPAIIGSDSEMSKRRPAAWFSIDGCCILLTRMDE